jgi:hypothetical protein
MVKEDSTYIKKGDRIWTPIVVAKDMVAWFKPQGKILEPCNGIGNISNWIPDTKGNVEFFVLHLSSPKIGKEMWRFGFDKDLNFIGWQIFVEGELLENQDLNLDSLPVKGVTFESALETILEQIDEKVKPNMIDLVEIYKSKKPRTIGSGMFCSPIQVKS